MDDALEDDDSIGFKSIFISGTFIAMSFIFSTALFIDDTMFSSIAELELAV